MGIWERIKSLFSNAGYPAIVGDSEKLSTNAFAFPYSSPYGGYNGGGAKWFMGLSHSGSAPMLDHSTLRKNARSAYHDSIQAKALVDRFADSVIDCGLKLEAVPDSNVLGITPEAAEQWGEKVESLFHLWAKSKNASRNGNNNFYQLQHMAEKFQQRDGEYFARFYYSPLKELINPLQISFIDPDQINGSAFTNTKGMLIPVEDGIERDKTGKTIAYHVNVYEKNKIKTVRVPAIGLKSRKPLMVQGFQPDYAGQGRGYPRLSHAIQEFENITDFTSAQIKKAINQSGIAMFVEPGKGEDSSNPMESITSGGIGSVSSSDGETQVEIDGVDDLLSYYDLPEATMTRPGSVGVFNLHKGEKLKPFESSAPAESFDKFVDSFVSHICASNGMPVEVLLMKFNQNYSASRASLILFWRVAKIWREELATDFLNPVYYAWLSGEIAAGRISAPGWQDARMKAAWLGNNWIGAPMPNIDPARTMAADRGYVEMGVKHLDEIARNENGSSGKMNRAKLTRQYQELPVAPWLPVRGGNNNG